VSSQVADREVAADELRVERLIAAPPDKVYAYWTEPERLVRWWGPEGYTIPDQSLDVRHGGTWRTTMLSPDGGRYTVSGIYRELVPPRRLVFTWGWEDADGKRGDETEVTVTFEAAPGGTRLVLRQRSFEDRKTRDDHQRGWESSLDCLVAEIG
jgi:uncharacterized protein YndB with AHSA1/START domain